ncbi:MAG: hypothetical protein KatS3mg112_1875 [Thermogutta sp.]|nr:MAG: hypothetical protein KatS3mg112_1875 [Thermogutta sp.]
MAQRKAKSDPFCPFSAGHHREDTSSYGITDILL